MLTSKTNFKENNIALFTKRNSVVENIKDLSSRKRKSVKIKKDIASATRKLDDIETSIMNLNKGLVISYARRFSQNGANQNMEDFQAAGVTGLIAAIKSYDIDKGPFAQWAYHPIQRAVTRAVRDADHPNLNPGDFERRPDILRARERLLKTGKEVTNIAIAKEAVTTVGQVRRILEAPRLISVDTRIGEENGNTIADIIPDPSLPAEDTIYNSMFYETLEKHCLTVVDARELYVLTKHFGLDGCTPQKLSTIGSSLKLSREAARQIESKALSKLGHPLVLRKLVWQQK
jgi:RNA polymerase sigma factor (sigma-70 family)